MDPKTVVTLLALNLIGVGGLLLLISRRVVDRAGLRGFATGAMVFGGAFLVRLVFGLESGALWGVVPDAAMVFALLSFVTGLRQFSGRPPIGPARVLGIVALFAAVAVAAALAWPASGRLTAINLALGPLYGLLAFVAATGAQRESPQLRSPLRLLALMTGVLAVLTGLRGLVAGFYGTGPLFAGPWAQTYFGYSMVFTMLLGPTLLWMVFLRLNQRLADLATHDPLTRLLNRHGLQEAVQRLLAARPPQPLVLLLVDVDHFKRINDTHGHATGDAVLVSVADALAAQLRGGDLVARWGGEEFLVVCPGADPAWAHELADRLRQAVVAHPHAGREGQRLPCTVSIGISTVVRAASDWEAALRAADEALYAAKAAGRNRVQAPPTRQSAAAG